MNLRRSRFELRLARTWRISSGVGRGGTQSYPVLFVELSDDQGRAGLGEGAPSSRYGESVDGMVRALSTLDPGRLSFEDVPGSMRYVEAMMPGAPTARCALNVALLDGAARSAGLALCDYLSLGFNEGKHVTSFSIGLDEPEVMREKIHEAAGYPVLKLKVGSPDDRINLAIVREVAPMKPVRVDANEAWKTREEALRNIEWLAEDGRVEFVEQPMPAGVSIEDWAWLKERSPLPIFGDESYHQAADAGAAARCFHGVNVKLVKSGGVSGARAALEAARGFGLRTMIGCMIESSVLISAAAHLAELADHLDLDGNLLVNNDPFSGVSAERGAVSFASAQEKCGLRVRPGVNGPGRVWSPGSPVAPHPSRRGR